MTGGVPINTFRNLIDMDWLNNLIDNNSCIKGVVFAETIIMEIRMPSHS